MSRITSLVKRMQSLRTKLAQMDAEYQQLRLETLKAVEISSRGNTLTLRYGRREVKAKKMGAYNLWRVWEGNRVLIREFHMGGLHDIRFMIATGQI